jgi:putative sterol carrier protein
MSEIVTGAVKALNERLEGGGLPGTVKFVILDEGTVLIDEDGARAPEAPAGDAPADCTMTASADTFRGLLDGGINPTAAFMSGKLKVEGDMGLAMKLGALLS